MKTRRSELFEFIEGLYVPKQLQDEFAKLRTIIYENDYRGITLDDRYTMHNDCLIIETKGKGAYETFKGFYIARVDVGSIGKDMANIAIYKPGINLAEPLKVLKGNIRINIPLD